MFLLVLLGEWLCGSSKLLSFLFHFVEGSETGEEGNEIGAFARFACVCISYLHNRRLGAVCYSSGLLANTCPGKAGSKHFPPAPCLPLKVLVCQNIC